MSLPEIIFLTYKAALLNIQHEVREVVEARNHAQRHARAESLSERMKARLDVLSELESAIEEFERRKK